MSPHQLARLLGNPLVVIVFQLGLCILLLGEVAKGAMGYTPMSVLLLQFVGAITVAIAVAELAGLTPTPADPEH